MFFDGQGITFGVNAEQREFIRWEGENKFTHFAVPELMASTDGGPC